MREEGHLPPFWVEFHIINNNNPPVWVVIVKRLLYLCSMKYLYLTLWLMVSLTAQASQKNYSREIFSQEGLPEKFLT